MPLADVQAAIRGFVVGGDEGAGLALVGGQNPVRRLAIHRRHYRASLTAALAGKFPATAWLVGAAAVEQAAGAFVTRRPPVAPCIAEYGADFPRFLADAAGDAVPYLFAFATLEWHVGQVSVAVDLPSMRAPAQDASDPALGRFRVSVQPGVRLVAADWPVDTLLSFFLTDSAPESFPIERGSVFLQVRGARGDFTVDRLTSGRFAFREALASGATIADALLAASRADGATTGAGEVRALFDEGLLTALHSGPAGPTPLEVR